MWGPFIRYVSVGHLLCTETNATLYINYSLIQIKTPSPSGVHTYTTLIYTPSVIIGCLRNCGFIDVFVAKIAKFLNDHLKKNLALSLHFEVGVGFRLRPVKKLTTNNT